MYNYKKIYKSLIGLPFIDKLTAIAFIIVLLIASVFFLRKGDYVYITMRVSQDTSLTYTEWGKPPPWFTEQIKPDETGFDIFGKETIKIIDVYRYDADANDLTLDYYVTLKIKSVYSKNNDLFTYNGFPLYIGSYQKIAVKNIQINGIVVSVSKERIIPKQEKFFIKGFLDNKNNDFPYINLLNQTYFGVSLYKSDGVPKSISSLLHEGLTITDSDNKNIITVKKVNKFPAFFSIPENGQFFYIFDQDREKVEMELEILATIIDGKPFYKQDIPLYVNQVIKLSFPNVHPVLTLTDILPSTPEAHIQ